ncbi:MAG: V-type ATP synthase subunit D [Candidatus Omnitrophica bacterium]|nr:V-type ATP synthase subunit D [Candidatus Omnitrophota bacterium]
MSKIKLTKGEMKRQRDALKQFRRYLPTLQLKKQQLQMKITEVRKVLDEQTRKLKYQKADIFRWVGVLAEKTVELKQYIIPTEIAIEQTNIAGAKVPVFEKVVFKEIDYDLYTTPFWTDRAIKEMQEYVRLYIDVDVTKKQIRLLEHELLITTQRVNLFEKVKIPECKENIRKITIYLGDQQANAVGVGKVAKKKIEQRSQAALAAV